MSRALFVFILLVSPLAACNRNGGDGASPDGSIGIARGPDAATLADAALLADAAMLTDASARIDASIPIDAAVRVDAAVPVDAAMPPGGCVIAMVGYPTGTPNPSDPCQACNPTVTTSTWTALGDGASCGHGLVCITGACTADCFVAGQGYTAATRNPANPCETCQPSVTTTAFSPAIPGTTCGSGLVCIGATCEPGCSINGQSYASGTPEPGEPCEACEPASQPNTWSVAPNGSSCGAGEICVSGECEAGCYIDGHYWPTGGSSTAAEELSSCPVCNPTVSTSSFTTLTCGTGQVCTNGACCTYKTCAEDGFTECSYFCTQNGTLPCMDVGDGCGGLTPCCSPI